MKPRYVIGVDVEEPLTFTAMCGITVAVFDRRKHHIVYIGHKIPWWALLYVRIGYAMVVTESNVLSFARKHADER